MTRSGGRPTAADAAVLGDRIVAAAAELFLRDGYAATSIEAIASLAGVSKRTFYARFDGKGPIFLAVVRRLIGEWLVGFETSLETAPSLEAALLAASRKMLDVALTPSALALHALITAESMRFPELVEAVREAGADIGTVRVAGLLRHHLPGLSPASATLAAEQFQGLIIHAPQRRALASGTPLDDAARDHWCRAGVSLLLHGVATPATT
jgi:TetR/AcrR family transcriptional repressor of mexJK operon